eukprot:scaffold480_cov257-Pinguiococcus_pyrenoidosus.AAC.15
MQCLCALERVERREKALLEHRDTPCPAGRPRPSCPDSFPHRDRREAGPLLLDARTRGRRSAAGGTPTPGRALAGRASHRPARACQCGGHDTSFGDWTHLLDGTLAGTQDTPQDVRLGDLRTANHVEHLVA